MTNLKTLKDIALDMKLTDGTVIAKRVQVDVKELKQEGIKHIKSIQRGSGVDRTKFPEDMKGSYPKDKWNDGIFTLGIEYGFIIGLMEFFDITEEDLK